ncbi:MAG: hypothetical protein OXE99_10835 [Cellvibrionales bacterium]|nr:hypothetical protein [Cellvibrionales bacterium]
MRDNLIQFPTQYRRPELIDELTQSMSDFFQVQVPECEIEKSMMATSIFHFLVASKIALDHLGKIDESAIIMDAVRSIESTWPHYEEPLDGLMKDLSNTRSSGC